MNRKKNIAFFTFGLLNYSGAAMQALKVANELTENTDYKVIFFNKQYTVNRFLCKSLIHKGYQIIDLPEFLPFRFIFIAYYVLRFRIRVCHFHCFLAKSMLLCLMLDRRIILKTTLLGEDDFDTQLKNDKKSLLRFVLSKISYNVVLTKHLQAINQQYITPDKVKLIYNGITIQEPPKSKSGNTFCYLGFVGPRKRTYNTILYFAENYAHLPNAKLYIIGPYNASSDLPVISQEYYNSCVDLINRYQIESQVIFTGNLPIEKVFEIYKQSKALIFLSSKEGFPNGVLEAMSCNCVPIISPMDGVADELIIDGVDGFILKDEQRIIPIDDIDNIVESEKTYQTVNKNFSIKKTVEQLVELYENLYK